MTLWLERVFLEADMVQLQSLAQKYICEVEKACVLILNFLNLRSKQELIEQRALQEPGEVYLDAKNKYAFHGRGCRFTSENLEIDWDFGYSDNWCGLDPWKLFYYAKNQKLNSDIEDGLQIKLIFDELVAEGKMVKKYNLYYFLD